MSDFWKNKYKDQWKTSNQKEKEVARLITESTGLEIEFTGFGANTDRFIKGSAESNGHKKGDADLKVKDKGIYIEVTGSNDRTTLKDDIWIRPDKIEHAAEMIKRGNITYLVHYVGSVFRVIPLDEKFVETYKNLGFKEVNPFIRGSQETFVAVPVTSKYLLSFDQFIKVVGNV